MRVDEDGFKYPYVDGAKCVNCGLCMVVCPALSKAPSPSVKPECYAAVINDSNVRMQSSSGGIFSAMAEAILDRGGCVYGCALDNQLRAKHIKAETLIDLARLRGSKYVQSDMQETYRDCLEELKGGREVLFSGTPCQISGLKNFLGRIFENLTTIDVICHGVPSPMVFECYKKDVERRVGSRLRSINFRSKNISWVKFSMCHVFEDSTKNFSQEIHENSFLRVFLSNLCLRESCYNCRSKGGRSGADITLADFWGVDNFYPEMDDRKGTSAVLLNTATGRKMFVEVRSRLKYQAVNFEQILTAQPSYYDSVQMPDMRLTYMRGFHNHNFDSWVRRCGSPTLVRRIVSKLWALVWC